jgi:hypothetical protein
MAVAWRSGLGGEAALKPGAMGSTVHMGWRETWGKDDGCCSVPWRPCDHVVCHMKKTSSRGSIDVAIFFLNALSCHTKHCFCIYVVL